MTSAGFRQPEAIFSFLDINFLGTGIVCHRLNKSHLTIFQDNLISLRENPSGIIITESLVSILKR